MVVVSTMFISTSSYAATILILGDSLSAGYGMSEDQGWVQLLRKQYPEHDIINGSVSGETTAGGLRRLPSLLDSSAFDLVVVELGGNDGLRGFPPNKLKSNLTKIIELSQDNGAKVLLTEIMVPPNYGPRYTSMFNDVYHQLADEFDIELVPFFMLEIAPNPDLMQRDGIHPNVEAQPRITQWMQPWIINALKK
ncbi:arylesterase [Shewanella sp. UCD-FRSSP16_17]|uniref:arylesterase n=1 Tax=unclassified Shewanella TaxID=196818 RepID=UPI0007EED66D|nr:MULTISPECIES: arylesterase [unclassified Shewanella]MBQ4888281.1 arylesterase [Shewanella sp. MMG014]OBT11869.1 arylesterase [Shewanella sp. UCD-FRSSP16_17]